MILGTVKWFNTHTGYGFIQPKDGTEYIFIHHDAIEKAGLSSLEEGQKVSYDLQLGMDGKPAAENLRILD